MCAYYFQLKAKGRGYNLKTTTTTIGRGRPAGKTPKSVMKYIQSIAPPNSLQDNEMPQFLSSSTCQSCLVFFTAWQYFSQQISCTHTVCSTCCSRSIQADSLQCPSCSNHILSSIKIHPPSSQSLQSTWKAAKTRNAASQLGAEVKAIS